MIVSKSIRISTSDPALFLFGAEQYSIVNMYHILFTHSSVDGRKVLPFKVDLLRDSLQNKWDMNANQIQEDHK